MKEIDRILGGLDEQSAEVALALLENPRILAEYRFYVRLYHLLQRALTKGEGHG